MNYRPALILALSIVVTACTGSTTPILPIIQSGVVQPTAIPNTEETATPAENQNENTAMMDTSDEDFLLLTPFKYRSSLVEPVSTIAELENFTNEFSIQYEQIMEIVFEQLNQVYAAIDGGLASSTDEDELKNDADFYDQLQLNCDLVFTGAISTNSEITSIDCGGNTAEFLYRHSDFNDIIVDINRYSLADGTSGNFGSRVSFTQRSVFPGEFSKDELSVSDFTFNAGSPSNQRKELKTRLNPPKLECDVLLEPFSFENLNINDCSATMRESILVLQRLM